MYCFVARMCPSLPGRERKSVTSEHGTWWNFPPRCYPKCKARQMLNCVQALGFK